jgi:hypothetical protein
MQFGGTSLTGPEVSITSRVRDLKIRSVAPGGFASVECALDHPYVFSPNELATLTSLSVYDGRSGKTVGEGYIQDPNRSAGPDGQVWSLVAYGPASHASDVEFPIVYSDTRAIDTAFGSVNGQLSSGDDPGGSGDTAVIVSMPDGMHVTTGTDIRARYRLMADCGQKIGRVAYASDMGNNDTNHQLQLLVHTSGGAFDNPRSENFSTGGYTRIAKVVVTDWANGRNMIDLRHVRALGGASVIPNDTYWASATQLVIVAMRYNADGSEHTSAYVRNGVTWSEVLADLLGRPGVVPLYDGANASIRTGVDNLTMDQVAYEDGTTFAKILEDLSAINPAYCWMVWERGFNKKHRFEAFQWPTTVRYAATVADGWSSPASSVELYNEVSVRWKDGKGRTRSTLVTQVVPQLADRKHRAILDLSDETGSATNATNAGNAFLADHASPLNAGTLTVARPIRDLQAGRLVMPWEIKPGSLIRVSDVFPNADALNATGRDGQTVFVVKSNEFTASSASSSLELDSYSRTTARALARVANRAVFKRR